MIIEKGQTNENLIIRGLSDFTTISGAKYLFKFISPLNVDYTVIPTNTTPSGVSSNYSSFTIIEGVDDRENGSLILGGQGVYELVIYEQSSTTNLDPDNATKVDYGTLVVRVVGTSDSTTDYIEHTIATSYIEHTV